MDLNEEIFNTITQAAASKTGKIVDKKIAVYSHKATILTRYLELSNPKFSRSGALAEKLTQVVIAQHPELWDRIIAEVPDAKENRPSQWEGKAEQLQHPDPQLLKVAMAEAITRAGRTVTIYNPRLAALFKYLDHTTPRFSISSHAAGMLEEILSKEYPVMWEQIEKLTS